MVLVMIVRKFVMFKRDEKWIEGNEGVSMVMGLVVLLTLIRKLEIKLFQKKFKTRPN